MSDDEREELLTTLHGLGKAVEQCGDVRDKAAAACLYGLCLAIRKGAEVELARHILMLDGDSDIENADAAMKAGDMRGH